MERRSKKSSKWWPGWLRLQHFNGFRWIADISSDSSKSATPERNALFFFGIIGFCCLQNCSCMRISSLNLDILLIPQVHKFILQWGFRVANQQSNWRIFRNLIAQTSFKFFDCVLKFFAMFPISLTSWIDWFSDIHIGIDAFKLASEIPKNNPLASPPKSKCKWSQKIQQ